mmetsp:Transcript_36911/g.80374  ORF Transcript_36911/g.80374 Transcript_36911/m.80374 type:complete len:206 (+) Transcript_36911:1325-1942(+)
MGSAVAAEDRRPCRHHLCRPTWIPSGATTITTMIPPRPVPRTIRDYDPRHVRTRRRHVQRADHETTTAAVRRRRRCTEDREAEHRGRCAEDGRCWGAAGDLRLHHRHRRRIGDRTRHTFAAAYAAGGEDRHRHLRHRRTVLPDDIQPVGDRRDTDRVALSLLPGRSRTCDACRRCYSCSCSCSYSDRDPATAAVAESATLPMIQI